MGSYYTERQLKEAHKASRYNKVNIENSRIAGCFHCLEFVPAREVVEYVSNRDKVPNITACCPYCGIDSLIPDNSYISITKGFLRCMRKYWFDGLDKDSSVMYRCEHCGLPVNRDGEFELEFEPTDLDKVNIFLTTKREEGVKYTIAIDGKCCADRLKLY